MRLKRTHSLYGGIWKMDQNELKHLVAKEAVKYIESGMKVGLGSGSTVKMMVDELGKRVQNENLDIVCASTSKFTGKQAEDLGIVVKPLDEIDELDLTIDGADEIDTEFNGIKGGGAAHLWEKIVAINSKKNMWIVDQSKMVEKLGKFPLPLEVIPFGSTHLFKKLESKGYSPEFRMRDGKHVMTDSQNYIIDLHLEQIDNPAALAKELDGMTGLVEHGLFLDIVDYVIIATESGVKKIARPGESF